MLSSCEFVVRPGEDRACA